MTFYEQWVMVYIYTAGLFSSRMIERRPYEGLAFRILGAGDFHKHRTSVSYLVSIDVHAVTSLRAVALQLNLDALNKATGLRTGGGIWSTPCRQMSIW